MPEQEPDAVTEHTKITDHADRGVAILPLQFRKKEFIAALLRSWLKRAQDIEDAFWDLIVETTLQTSIGDALDQIGELLAFSRGVLDDDDYRVILRAIIRARKSSGTSEDLLDVIGLLLGSIDFSTLDGYASWFVEPHEPMPFSAEVVLSVLGITKAGGVQLQLIDPPDEETDLFTFSTSQFFMQADAFRGFSDVDQLVGGKLTRVID